MARAAQLGTRVIWTAWALLLAACKPAPAPVVPPAAPAAAPAVALAAAPTSTTLADAPTTTLAAEPTPATTAASGPLAPLGPLPVLAKADIHKRAEKPLGPEHFAFVRDGWVFLRPVTPDEEAAWGVGEVKWNAVLSYDPPWGGYKREGHAHEPRWRDFPAPIATRELNPAKLPPGWPKWTGRQLVLGKEGKALCHARVGQLTLLTRTNFGSEEKQEWVGLPAAERQRVLTEAFWRKDPMFLAARLQDLSPDCQDATWARDARLPLPARLVSTEVACDHPAVRRADPLLSKLRYFAWRYGDNATDSVGSMELKRMAADQREWERAEKAGEEGSEWEPLVKCHATVFSGRDAKPVAAWVQVAVDGDEHEHEPWRRIDRSCEYAANFLASSEKHQKLLLDPSPANGCPDVEHIIDWDGDGVLEWGDDENLWQPMVDGSIRHQSIAFPRVLHLGGC